MVITNEVPRPRLLVVGAGPKAMAISAKAAVLSSLGLRVPDVTIAERAHIGAHWDGSSGLTDGSGLLGTPPEKDVGFPYRSSAWGSALNDAVNARMRRFSWQAYLTETSKPPGPYWQWVDRGKPAPAHSDWAEYLRWVARRSGARVVRAEVKTLDVDGPRWIVSALSADGGELSMVADGVVVTGPGSVRTRFFEALGHPRLLDPYSVWGIARSVEVRRQGWRIAVIGAGETAAAIVEAIAPALHRDSYLHVITRQGTIYSRSENWAENQVFSQPSVWESLDVADRMEFIRRTDRGVFSQQAQQRLAGLRNVESIAGNAQRVWVEGGAFVVDVSYAGSVARRTYDWVVDATALDAAWFADLLTGRARARLPGSGRAFDASIGWDLAVEASQPRLHLPMLAALRQGPGFPNLSCLGLLSDRVLAGYVDREEAMVEAMSAVGIA